MQAHQKPLCKLTKAPKEPGTLLTFEMLLPSISKNGVCTPPGLTVEVPKDERCIIGFTDFAHAIMSVMVFMAIALSDHRVTDCLHVKEMDEVMESFPLMVGWCNLLSIKANRRLDVICFPSTDVWIPSVPTRSVHATDC
ncbi:hypothetical protein DKX38_012617 [Salix brachista]|uniref:Uncharacterized protein n=1 Tax=Salix brachista TaxID=2182728 RepID=A0A5N5LNY9_9ROSI|nr:hypothetical protein DKX38_012617 [Salix brachista]